MQDLLHVMEIKKEDYHALVEIIDFLKKEYSIKNLKILAFYPFKDEPFFLKSRLGLDFSP